MKYKASCELADVDAVDKISGIVSEALSDLNMGHPCHVRYTQGFIDGVILLLEELPMNGAQKRSLFILVHNVSAELEKRKGRQLCSPMSFGFGVRGTIPSKGSIDMPPEKEKKTKITGSEVLSRKLACIKRGTMVKAQLVNRGRLSLEEIEAIYLMGYADGASEVRVRDALESFADDDVDSSS
jgi:hypothetical protein